MHNFKELNIWKRSVDLAVKVYQLVQDFPKEEKFGLTSQITRCAVSIGSNIAEGAGRNTDKDFNNFLGIALGSSFELETQLIIATKIGIIDDEKFKSISSEILQVQKMINGFKRKLVY
jgi:four helix bundle protein